MAQRKPTTGKRRATKKRPPRRHVKRRARRLRRTRVLRAVRRWIWRWVMRISTFLTMTALVVLLAVVALRWLDPALNIYMASEWRRTGKLEREWIPLADMSAHLPRAAVAAEDAKFCAHSGFDFEAIRLALDGGARRGGSTITQQTAKNVFLWQERSWLRKGLEAGFALLIEAAWGKQRIVEVYLNIAEFDESVFGVEAAAQHYFGKGAADVSLAEASRLMAILPNPKARSASRPGKFTQRRARQIAAGAETIRADGRAACFQ